LKYNELSLIPLLQLYAILYNLIQFKTEKSGHTQNKIWGNEISKMSSELEKIQWTHFGHTIWSRFLLFFFLPFLGFYRIKNIKGLANRQWRGEFFVDLIF